MNVDFKVTTWERVEIPEEKEEEVLALIKNGQVSTSNELLQSIEGLRYEGHIDDTDEQMCVEENGGCATIDIMEDGDSVWTNEPEEE